MIRPLALLSLLLVAPLALAQPNLKDARTRLLHGNYAEAATAYKAAAEGDSPSAAAFVGWSRALQYQGEYDQALTVTEQGLQKLKDDPDILARQAEVLYLRGKWDEAEKAADKALVNKPEHFPARWVKA